MRRRLYFVLPDVKSAETIERELLLAKIEDSHIHFLAKDGINLGRLGFLVDVSPDNLVHRLDQILDGEFEADRRTLLDARSNAATCEPTRPITELGEPAARAPSR